MAKGKTTKKKNFKLRRQLRKTLGCLFMVSALIVTAIPVTPAEAAADGWWVTNTSLDGANPCWQKSTGGTIPDIPEETDGKPTPVYQDDSENFRFVYVDKHGKCGLSSDKEKFAVIVDYNRDQVLPGGNLTIPSTMDAYVKFTDSGSNGTYAAANKQGKPLYYKKSEVTKTSVPGPSELTSEDLNNDGILNDYITTEITKTTAGFASYEPCIKAQKDIWSPNNEDEVLYYYTSADGIPPAEALVDEDYVGADGATWKAVTDDTDNRIAAAKVKYIGKNFADYDETKKQYIIQNKPSSAERSVFGGTGEGAAAGNIISLTISDELVGIGDYAFYGCTNVNSIKLANGLNTLGNYAFANCINLNEVLMDYNTNISTLGAYAFANCGMLQSFALPTSVQNIGDFCFMNCTNMKKFDMTGESYDKTLGFSLRNIGHMAFYNCSSLESLTLPASYNGSDYKEDGATVFHLSTVMGCKNLKFISTPSQQLRFVTDAQSESELEGGYDGGSGKVDGAFTFDEFKNQVGEEFYFEAPGYMDGSGGKTRTPVHKTANLRHICFKYYKEDRFEIVEPSKDTSDKDVGLVFEVNSPGELIGFRIEDPKTGAAKKVPVPDVVMPEKIGPYGIKSIVAGSFDNNCWIQRVTIPASVVNIGPGAFKGSHNLQHVIFTDAATLETLGADAFATQVIDANLHAAGGLDGASCAKNEFLKGTTPFLSFSGAIEKNDGTNTEPFKFAMKSSSKINAGEQHLSYITYYSGWPTNLTVKYNPETQMSELQDFVTKEDLDNGFKVESASYPGAYRPIGTKLPAGTGYKYPYITDAISAEAPGAFTSGGTENQASMKNGVENIVIPNGVNSIKKGLFSGLDENGFVLGSSPAALPEGNPAYNNPAPNVVSLTVKSVAEIGPYTFARMPELTKAYISGAMTVGDYVFDECPKLESAEIGADTTTLGLRPFSGCESLTTVTFPSSTSFTAEDGIIYGLDAGGVKTKIVECLESRGGAVGSRVVGPDELAGIKEIAPEAFMDCDAIRQVDLTSSVITEIPVRCFAEADNLNVVRLPSTAKAIRDGSFWNTKSLASVLIPDGVTVITPNAFAAVPINTDGTYGEPLKSRSEATKYGLDNMMSFDFIAMPGSTADLYAVDYDYISVTQDDSLKAVYTVKLFDAVDETNPQMYKEYNVRDGENLELTVLDIPDHTAEGYQFSRWWPSADVFNPIVADTEIWAMYVPIGAKTYTVRFFDINKEEMTEHTQQVVEGGNAKAPSKSEMEVDGKVFTGWDRDFTNITSNLDVYAQYTDRAAGKYYVTFWTDMDMSTMIGKIQEVNEGESAIEPAHPTKEGYTFSRWSSDAWQNVTKDLDIFAVYEPGSGSGSGEGGGDSGEGGSGSGDQSGGSGSGSDSSSGNSVSGNGTKYKVVVNGGSGSGDYVAGEIVPINAYARADGTVFDKWSSSSYGVGFVDQKAISTTFTMPANNVVIDANFKVGGASSSVSGNSRNTRRNSTTSVDITKGGISNTDKASANVNGSSDNYIVKITEDAQATAAVIAALEAKYGDLSNIAYLPMDISLYDSTGTVKITDISGITVDITLPLPDELIQYAGNNRAASVVNGQLEELNAKFTTIDGVPCIQFTATHFSPYTIYVDKAHLTEGTIDATPKTGDPIHPKWFLAMGLACISVVLFCKKDRQPKLKRA